MREITSAETYRLIECLKALAEYHNKVSTNFKGGYPHHEYSKTIEMFSDSIDRGVSRIAVIEESNQIIAFCKIYIENNQGKLDYLVVLEEYRGKGHGKTLMDWAMEIFKKSHIHKVEVKVVDGNTALSFYEKYGFKMNAHLLCYT